jgi:hypothetical protein
MPLHKYTATRAEWSAACAPPERGYIEEMEPRRFAWRYGIEPGAHDGCIGLRVVLAPPWLAS